MTYHVSFPGLGFEVTVDRVAFTVFGMPIYWYGVLIALGLLLGMLYAFRNAKSYGIDADRMVDVLFVSTLAAIAGGRAYYVATAPFEYESVWQMLDIRQGGIAIYGAVIAAFAAGALMCRLRKVPMLPMFDLAAQGFLIGQCIGRWGNFVNQEAFGTNTALPWGMISEGTRSYLASVQQTLAAQGVAVDPSLPVHPTFLYESLWCGLGFLLLWRYSRRRRFHGEVLLLYVMWYGFERFFVEGLRTDSLMVGRFRVSQVLAGAAEDPGAAGQRNGARRSAAGGGRAGENGAGGERAAEGGRAQSAAGRRQRGRRGKHRNTERGGLNDGADHQRKRAGGAGEAARGRGRARAGGAGGDAVPCGGAGGRRCGQRRVRARQGARLRRVRHRLARHPPAG